MEGIFSKDQWNPCSAISFTLCATQIHAYGGWSMDVHPTCTVYGEVLFLPDSTFITAE